MPRNEPQQALGRAIRQLREEANLTQTEFADKAEMHVTWISKVEGGKVNPGWATFKQLARALGLRPSELAEREEQLEKKKRGRSSKR